MITLSYYTVSGSTNAVCIDLAIMKLYFSYDQIVAYWTEDDGLIVADNIWSRTTGKHTAQLMKQPRARRVKANELESRLHNLMRRLIFAYNHLELMRIVEESNEKATK